MENRWFQRTPAKINVMIHYAPLGLVSGVTKDISCLGMYIHTNSIILSCEESVDISFRYPDNEFGKSFSLEAEIVHSDENGAGLQFLDFQLMLPSGDFPINPVPYPQ
ncbi:MAG: PilZ domain-containing protein [Gammaproteobacteria bacterium]|nr:PilZ domain-containing protein [Gammaproteobacteria bacterium]